MMSEWINVEDDLPENNKRVLALVFGYFPKHMSDLCQKRSYQIFEADFNRTTGWSFSSLKEIGHVHFWMPRPENPKDIYE
jgi:hypothetical protein